MSFSCLSGAKILVIGANSFIGSHLVPALKSEGAIVYGTQYSRASSEEKGANLYLDITNFDLVENVISHVRPDYIFNLAGFVKGGRKMENIWPAFKVNLEGTVNLLMAVNNYPCKRVIIMGSLDEYRPDSGSARPVSPYAASKIASSAYGRMFQLLFNIPIVIAQPFMVFGPNQKDNTKLVPYTILSCLNGNTPFFSSGTRLADWVFIQDVVGGLKHIACHQGIEGCTIEIGTGQLTSVRDVVLKIFKALEIESTPNFGFISDRQYENIISADTAATHKLIGWKAQIDIDQGIKETVTWYKAQFGIE